MRHSAAATRAANRVRSAAVPVDICKCLKHLNLIAALLKVTAACIPCRPTDFSGLFPKASQQQAAAGCGKSGGMQPQTQQPGRAARTFEDLAGNRHSRQALGELLPGSNWLPDVLPLHADASNHPSAAVVGGGSERQLPASCTGETSTGIGCCRKQLHTHAACALPPADRPFN